MSSLVNKLTTLFEVETNKVQVEQQRDTCWWYSQFWLEKQKKATNGEYQAKLKSRKYKSKKVEEDKQFFLFTLQGEALLLGIKLILLLLLTPSRVAYGDWVRWGTRKRCDLVDRMRLHSPLFPLSSAAAQLARLLHATAAPTAQEFTLNRYTYALFSWTKLQVLALCEHVKIRYYTRVMSGRIAAIWCIHIEAVSITRCISVGLNLFPSRGSTMSSMLFFSRKGFACDTKSIR